MTFFRHERVKGYKPGTPFGVNYLYHNWCKACKSLGIEGVDLYGGTKHSTVNSLKNDFTKDEIKQNGTGHKTNKAFERYYGGDVQNSSKIYEKAAEGLRIEPEVEENVQHPYNIVEVDFVRKVLK